MEKSNQSLILGLVIGAVVVLAGGFFFYFGAGCADGDCLGLVRKAKIKAPTTTNQPVAEQPKQPAEAPKPPQTSERRGEPMQFDSQSTAIAQLDQFNFPKLFPYEYKDLSGIAAGEANVYNGKIWATILNNCTGDDDDANIGFQSIAIENSSRMDWNNVTVKATADVLRSAWGDSYYFYVVIYEDGQEIADKFGYYNQSNFKETRNVESDPFTMESGKTYHIVAYFKPFWDAGTCNEGNWISAQMTDIEWNI